MASLTLGTCNKCGETMELIFAGCVCQRCSDLLQEQWGGSAATDWVLFLPTPAAEGENLFHYMPTPAGWLRIIELLREKERKGPNKQSEASPPEANGWPPLGLLSCVSPEAELFRPADDLGFTRYIFRGVTFDQMKAFWANAEPDGGVEIGGADSSDLAELLSNFWPNRALMPALMRPAIDDEIATREAIFRDLERREHVERILNKWGFDPKAIPFVKGVTDLSKQAQCAQAWEEIREKFTQQKLLEGSVFEQETELKAIYDAECMWSHKGSHQEALELLDSIRVVRPRPSRSSTAATQSKFQNMQQEPLGAVRGLSKVAGMADLKEQLIHEVIGPFRDPELYRRYRVSLPNGILFYGPPGCGKTYLARALAEELGWSFQYCRPSDVASPYIHDTVSKIRATFSAAIEKAPSIVFIDEFEAFVPARSALGGHQQYKAEEVNEFLANLDGCAERNVLVIAATNEPEKIDPAVRRSGRFDKLIFISPPDAEARAAMLDFHLQERPAESSLDTAGIAAVLEGYSASDVKLLVDEAARMALKRACLISTDIVLAALARVPASITVESMQRYREFQPRGTA
jgi:transitional endoplasmic reticulum ATPase